MLRITAVFLCGHDDHDHICCVSVNSQGTITWKTLDAICCSIFIILSKNK